MGVFHVFQIVQIEPNCAKHQNYFSYNHQGKRFMYDSKKKSPREEILEFFPQTTF